MPFRRMCLTGHVLKEGMSYWRVCLIEGHVLTRLTGGHVLQENMYYGRACLTDRHDLKNVLQVDMSYWRSHFMGGHVLRMDMSYWRTCLAGGHVLQEDMSYGRTCLMSGLWKRHQQFCLLPRRDCVCYWL